MGSDLRSGGLEQWIVARAPRLLPSWIMRWLSVVYYRLNRYRLRLFTRPPSMKETFKARDRRMRQGLFDTYFLGDGLDIGHGGDFVVEGCRGWEIEDGDAHELAEIDGESFDFVYSSHLLEHLTDPARAIRNWWRVLKPGGYLILYVPGRDLFEKKQKLPSRFSGDHLHFFLLETDDPPDTIGLVPLLRRELPGCEIPHAQTCGEGHTITDPAIYPDGEYSVEVIARKP
jgi:SAM-dependent methyltransferase